MNLFLFLRKNFHIIRNLSMHNFCELDEIKDVATSVGTICIGTDYLIEVLIYKERLCVRSCLILVMIIAQSIELNRS